MNKDRRKRIEAQRDKLDEIRAELETIRDEEQDYYDNMPESIQSGTKGQAAEASVEVLDDAISSIQEAMDHLDNVEGSA